MTSKKLNQILKDMPPCQERQIKFWLKQIESTPPPFLLCNDHPCVTCILFYSTMKSTCPYCRGTYESSIVLPRNRLALCRNIVCKCGQEYKIIFNKILCELCDKKVECLSMSLVTPELYFREKIK